MELAPGWKVDAVLKAQFNLLSGSKASGMTYLSGEVKAGSRSFPGEFGESMILQAI